MHSELHQDFMSGGLDFPAAIVVSPTKVTTMRILGRSWLCLLALLLLLCFSLVTGFALEFAVRSSADSAGLYLGGRPLPPLTQWFHALHADCPLALVTLPFYPTLIASAYLWILLASQHSLAERHARFALAAFSCFASITVFTVITVFAAAVPFMPFSGGMMKETEPPTPLLYHSVWIAFIMLAVANLALAGRFLISAHRTGDKPSSLTGEK
jgi:hypothetical protein